VLRSSTDNFAASDTLEATMTPYPQGFHVAPAARYDPAARRVVAGLTIGGMDLATVLQHLHDGEINFTTSERFPGWKQLGHGRAAAPAAGVG
jgi:hypothetical protein